MMVLLNFGLLIINKQVKQIEVHESGITSVNFTSEGRYLMTTSQDHIIKLIDVKKFEVVWEFENDMYINGSNTSRSSISPGGDHAVIGSNNGSVLVLKLNYGDIALDEIYKKRA